MRTCPRGHDLDVEGEYVYGAYRMCKPCKRADSRRYTQSVSGKARRAARRERQRALDRERSMVRERGVTVAAFRVMLARQGGVCAICGEPERARSTVGKPRRISIDHDHDTGQTRGLLCNNCNRGLGLLRDDLALVESAQRYLQTWFPR